ncbi:MAG TPA: DUF2079 domain-containing protein [Polyangiaceae bacterium]|nr:DUF2079 domain-containing protein [Polyangiaceae bacterium]
MSGSSEAGAPQPESGAAADGSPLPEASVAPELDRTDAPQPSATEPPAAELEAPASPAGEASAPPVEAPRAALSTDKAAADAALARSARILVLAALVVGAIGLWSQLAFRSPWLDAFLLDNEIEPERRTLILGVTVGGFGVGGLLALGALRYWRTKARDLAELESWLWFLSPLMLMPLGPMLFRPKVWLGRYDALLPLMILVLLVFEVLAFRALTHAPPAVVAWWKDAVGQIPAKARRHGPLVIVTLAAAFYAAFFIFYTLRWHYKLRTGNYDLSINNNLMYGGLHGRFLHSPLVFPKEPAKYLANHVKLGAYLFLPIYAIFPRAETLFVIQSLFIGFGAVPLFLFARRHVSEAMAMLVALAYLAYYPLHGASFSEFQAVPVAAALIFTVIWAADARRHRILGVAFAAALLMREDVSVGLAVVGVFLLLTGYRPRVGLVIAGVSTAYFLLLRFYVMDAAGSWWFPNMYKDLWADGEKGFRSVIKTLLSNPTFTLSKIIVEKKLVYMLHLLVPIAFLPVRRWYLWAALLPGAFLTLLVTNYDPPITFSFHYVMHWAPYLFVAVVLSLEALRNGPVLGLERHRAAAATLVAASLVLSYNYGAFARREGSFKAGFSKIEFTFTEAEYDRYQELLELTSVIPKDASVAATEKCGPHLSSRLNMFTMRNGPQTADWIVGSSRELKLSKTRPTLKDALESGRYGVVNRIGDFALMKKGYATDGNQALIDDWEL